MLIMLLSDQNQEGSFYVQKKQVSNSITSFFFIFLTLHLSTDEVEGSVGWSFGGLNLFFEYAFVKFSNQ